MVPGLDRALGVSFASLARLPICTGEGLKAAANPFCPHDRAPAEDDPLHAATDTRVQPFVSRDLAKTARLGLAGRTSNITCRPRVITALGDLEWRYKGQT